ncbi:MAG: DUF507 family protein [Nitrospirae bacterium]|nr:DUF507 family protein [Nitrospirota bacterium]MBI5694156.1 DUF507 family protein [Nitrospirota bacterium]
MRLSEDKISHLSHVAFDALVKGGAAELLADDAKVRRELKQLIARRVKEEDEVGDIVRKKIQSYSRRIMEGSPEWDVMFRKHYEEEMNKRGK